MRIAVSRDLRTPGDVIELPTPQHYDELIAVFKTLQESFATGFRIKQIIGGIAGQMDESGNRLLMTTNISSDWLNKPLGSTLKKMFNAPVQIINDTALGALGEAVYGAGRGSRIVAFLMLGTGYGGARIVDQRIDVSALGFEPGKQRIIINNGKAVTIGSLVSGRGVTKRYKKSPRDINDAKIWRNISEIFGYSVVNAILLWSPDVVVLGGSMLKNPGIIIPVVRRIVKKNLAEFPKTPGIIRGKLGDKFGLYGALALANELKTKSSK